VHLRHQPHERLARVRAEAGRAEHAAPVGQHHVNTAFFQRREVRVGALRPGGGERAHPAALDLLGELRQAGDAGLHLPAHDRRLGRAAAREGDVGRLLGRAAERLEHQAERDVVRAARRAAAHVRRAGVGLQRVEEALDVADVGGGGHHHHARLLRQPRDRRHVLDAHRRLVGERGADHDGARHHQAVRAPAPLRHEARQSDGAARAAHVLELEVADEAAAPRRLLDGAAEPVPTAARRGGDEHVDGSEALLPLSAGAAAAGERGAEAETAAQAASKWRRCGMAFLSLALRHA
jgi:hypothetical protein